MARICGQNRKGGKTMQKIALFRAEYYQFMLVVALVADTGLVFSHTFKVYQDG